MDEQRVKYYLAVWKEWHSIVDSHTGYPHRSAYLGGAGPDFDDYCNAVDNRVAEAVEAIVSDMAIPLQCAVLHFNLGAVWRLRSKKPMLLAYYAEALEELASKLVKRGFD